MPVIRDYHCDECGQEFRVTCNSSDPAPDCPHCNRVLEWTPGLFSITGTKSKAVDVTQQIMEQEFGYSNFNDNMREGDIAVKAAAPTGAQIDAEIRQLSEASQQMHGTPPLNQTQAEMAKAFWGGGQTPLQQVPAAEMLNNARAATQAANAENRNPMQLLHKAGKAGQLKTPIHVIARG